MTLQFGTDGVRGHALTELTPDFVEALGRAAAQVLGGDEWIVGWDPRASSPVLAQAVADGIAATGAAVRLAGVIPTPGLAAAGASRGVPTAMVTASHNPWHDNGVKFFAAGGLKLTDDVETRIEHFLAAAEADPFVSPHERTVRSRGDMNSPAAEAGLFVSPHERTVRSGGDMNDGGVLEEYCAGLVGSFPAGCLDGLRIVLDCANGAMSVAAPRVARALGADVQVIHATPDGRNINDHCGATHTDSLAEAVVANNADLGLAFDGDGDRVIAIDHLGNRVDGDRLIALAALQLKEHGELIDDTVVVTVMSNLGFHRAMAGAGIRVLTTPVGDRYVLEALDTGRYSIGGEQSGHIIYRRHATTGDGLLAGLHLAQFVAEHHRPLAVVAAEVMTSYPQVLVNVRVARSHPNVADELAAEIDAAERSLAGQGRVLLRPSGTEPLIRVMVEAATDATAKEVAEDLATVVRERFG